MKITSKPAVGTKIRCITDEFYFLTIGKEYEVVHLHINADGTLAEEYHNEFWFIDDKGDLMYSYIEDNEFELVQA